MGGEQLRTRRRTVLTAVGSVGALSLAGCLGDEQTADADESNSEDQSLHPRYGYPSTSMDDEEPVPSDHEINLMIGDPAEGSDHPTFYFDPVGLAIEPGDVVRFNFNTLDHGVAVLHEAFGLVHRAPEGAEPVSSPLMDTGTYWLCEFPEPGVWDLYCPPHERFGMGMRLVVGDGLEGPAAEPIDPETDEGRIPDEPLVSLLNHDAIDPERILEEGSVAWSELDEE